MDISLPSKLAKPLLFISIIVYLRYGFAAADKLNLGRPWQILYLKGVN